MVHSRSKLVSLVTLGKWLEQGEEKYWYFWLWISRLLLISANKMLPVFRVLSVLMWVAGSRLVGQNIISEYCARCLLSLDTIFLNWISHLGAENGTGYSKKHLQSKADLNKCMLCCQIEILYKCLGISCLVYLSARKK